MLAFVSHRGIVMLLSVASSLRLAVLGAGDEGRASTNPLNEKKIAMYFIIEEICSAQPVIKKLNGTKSVLSSKRTDQAREVS